ncbi:hypothetical protein CJA_1832 [Cellvibrio japonicus Ueda107]|uniref:Uncharacterized protein n=1 Tax=Cellvibrio japonicus (strain Ueda107) TaxID=498211 RepID=B3PFW7_CELJU|nr:hypothetical protein CJA_1832 [Cellvibrio japonicus Ueda107]
MNSFWLPHQHGSCGWMLAIMKSDATKRSFEAGEKRA